MKHCRWKFRIAASLVALTLSACASNSSPRGSGQAGADGGAGNGGTAGTSGSAGSSGAGTAGSAGADAAAGGGGAAAGTTGGAGSGADAGDVGSHDAGGDAASDGGTDAPTLFGPITCTPGTAGDGKSNLAATSDPPEWKLGAGVKAGTVTAKASFASKTYNQHFPYWIYTSANYVPGQPAIFLLFGDGNQFLTDFHAATVLDNLTASKDLPPTVALFVDPPSDGDRVQTYDPPTPKYTTFLFDELLPAAIFGKYSISRDPEAWSIVGYSASGGQGWEVLWNRPNDVHKFLGDNTSFGAAPTYGVDWVQVIKNAAPRVLRVSLLTSTNDLADNRGMWIVINTNVANQLDAKGNQWRLVIGSGAHYPPVDGERDFPTALRWLWRGCHF
jgi:enterochelin esterase family protein